MTRLCIVGPQNKYLSISLPILNILDLPFHLKITYLKLISVLLFFSVSCIFSLARGPVASRAHMSVAFNEGVIDAI